MYSLPNQLTVAFACPTASFLFWQQYFDSPDGTKYSHYYLRDNSNLPHVGVIDPVSFKNTPLCHTQRTPAPLAHPRTLKNLPPRPHGLQHLHN